MGLSSAEMYGILIAALPKNGRRLALNSFFGMMEGYVLCASERGLLMVTYSDLIQIGILIVGIIGLFFRPIKRNDRRNPDKYGDHFASLTG